MDLVYDETFEGLLSTFFFIYQEKIEHPAIYKQSTYQPAFFETRTEVKTDLVRAERVLTKLKEKAGRQFSQFFYAAHNDRDHVENDLFAYTQYMLAHDSKRSTDYSNAAVLKVAQIAKAVGREKHRMEAFVRFRLTKDGIYFATIEPDFDVIPLIKKHFEERYGDQPWIIYDLRRNYGMHYDLTETKPIQIQFNTDNSSVINTAPELFTADELEFQQLWALYFKKTNIESRKNMKLHLQHVPRRYWKYLSEKTIDA